MISIEIAAKTLRLRIDRMCRKIYKKFKGSAWIRKVLQKNMYCALAHSGVDIDSWAAGEFGRFYTSSFETMVGNELGGFAEDLIKEIYPDADVKGGQKKKPMDIDAVYKNNNKQIHLQIKSSDLWGNASAMKNLAVKMAGYAKVLKDYDRRVICNVWGYTGGKNGFWVAEYEGVKIYIYGNEEFWKFVTGIDGFGSSVVMPAMLSASETLRQIKEISVKRLSDLAEKYKTTNGSVDFLRLYDENR